MIERYRVEDKPSIATFADMFRYRMIRDTGRCWVDADIFCLKRARILRRALHLCPSGGRGERRARQQRSVALAGRHPALAEMIATADARDRSRCQMGRARALSADPRFAAPRKSTRVRACLAQFYPVEPEQFWKLFLPARRREIETKIRARSSCTCGARRSNGAAGTPRSDRRRAAISMRHSPLSARFRRFQRIAEASEAEAAFSTYADASATR